MSVVPLWTPVVIEIFERLEESLLSDFLSVLPLPAHQPAVVEDFGPEMINETVECFGVACFDPADQFGFAELLQLGLLQLRFRRPLQERAG